MEEKEIQIEYFIAKTLLDLADKNISYDHAVVMFGEMFVKVYELGLEEGKLINELKNSKGISRRNLINEIILKHNKTK